MHPASGVTIGTDATTWQRSPLFGLRDSVSGGPVSVTYSLPLSGWYDGACTVTQGGEVVTGTTPFTTGDFTVDNGLLQLEGNALRMATGSPLAWGVSMNISALNASFSSPSLLVNTPDMVVVRYRVQSTGAGTAGTADMSMMRGSRTLTLAFNLDQPSFEAVRWGPTTSGGFGALTAPEAGSGIGYRSSPAPLTNMVYAAANDTDGNRRGLSYAGELDDPLTPGLYATATAKRSHVFGLHAIVGGGTTKTGADQLYGMDRAWFAMLAQQTSAGVL
jgi:hypothetical protein